VPDEAWAGDVDSIGNRAMPSTAAENMDLVMCDLHDLQDFKSLLNLPQKFGATLSGTRSKINALGLTFVWHSCGSANLLSRMPLLQRNVIPEDDEVRGTILAE